MANTSNTFAGAWKALLLLATGLISATLAASVRSFVVSDAPVISEELAISGTRALTRKAVISENPASTAIRRQFVPSLDTYALASIPNDHREAFTKPPASFAINKPPAEKPDASSYGLASYYGHKTRTANGEKGDDRDLTAAHRTLPFGTRVRVTNISTGQSVTVRINDRGPFVRGRIVDVSHAAAEKLGLMERGVAKVKLDVVQNSASLQ